MSRDNSKRARAINLMNANGNKPMADVVELLVKELAVNHAGAASYYKWIVKNKLAPGNVVSGKRGPKSKEVSVNSNGADVKAANLAKMKAISAKKQKSSVKKQKPSVKPETPMEMTVLEHDDSTVPEFLQRSDLKALGV